MLGNKTLLRYVLKFLHYEEKTIHPSPEVILDENIVTTFLDYNLYFCPYDSQFYEKEAFLMDEERASMLPMTAAGES